MNTEFVTIVQKLIAEQGKEVFLDAAKCKALLADYTQNEYKKESRLLLQALEAGVANAIEVTQELEICKQQQTQHLQDEYFWTKEISADVVETIALVLAKKEPPRCRQCGKEVQPEWKACPHCGAVQNEPAAPQTSPAASTAPAQSPIPPQAAIPQPSFQPEAVTQQTPPQQYQDQPQTVYQQPVAQQSDTKKSALLLVVGIVGIGLAFFFWMFVTNFSYAEVYSGQFAVALLSFISGVILIFLGRSKNNAKMVFYAGFLCFPSVLFLGYILSQEYGLASYLSWDNGDDLDWWKEFRLILFLFIAALVQPVLCFAAYSKLRKQNEALTVNKKEGT